MKLLEQARHVARAKHVAYRTQRAYADVELTHFIAKAATRFYSPPFGGT
jgi:hypothetical protein